MPLARAEMLADRRLPLNDAHLAKSYENFDSRGITPYLQARIVVSEKAIESRVTVKFELEVCNLRAVQSDDLAAPRVSEPRVTLRSADPAIGRSDKRQLDAAQTGISPP